MITKESSEAVLLSTAYLPPVEYFIAILQAKKTYLEVQEHYIRQTYRNRCLIATAGGVHALSIPVSKLLPNHCPIKDIKIDYSENWQRAHWKTIETAYNKSPFFLYYRDYFEVFYTRETTFLLDFNSQMLEVIGSLLHVQIRMIPTESYVKETSAGCRDLRQAINPKKCLSPDYSFRNLNAYRQVFNDKSAFIPNLSILDLLFNEGNLSADYLKQNLRLFA